MKPVHHSHIPSFSLYVPEEHIEQVDAPAVQNINEKSGLEYSHISDVTKFEVPSLDALDDSPKNK